MDRYWADSTGRRNTFSNILFEQAVECLCRCLQTQRFPGARVQCVSNGAQLISAMLAEISALGEVLAEQTVRVLVASALLWALRVAKVDLETGIDPQLRVLGHFGTLVPGQRATQVGRQAADRPCDGIPDGLCSVAGKSWPILDRLARPVPLHARQVQEHGEAGRAFYQRADRRTAETKNEVPLPMAEDGLLWSGSWSSR